MRTKNLKPIPKEERLDVLDRKWDVLIVLDACRYDTFKEVGFKRGSLKKEQSIGSWTEMWLKKTFIDNNYEDIVYISANPQTAKVKDKFYKHIPLYKDKWNEKYGTVLPEVVSQDLVEKNAMHPNKKIIAHYLQPHAPSIGEHKLYTPRSDEWEWNLSEARGGSISMDDFYEYYKENLERALNAVKKSLPFLSGKVVITSDHGYVFAEYNDKNGDPLIAHPKEGINIPELINVPWCEIDAGVIEEGKPDFSVEEDNFKKGEVKDKLRSLGYL